MERYEYTVTFLSEVNANKKQLIVQKLQQMLGPYVVDKTIEATSTAIEIKKVVIGERHPLVTS